MIYTIGHRCLVYELSKVTNFVNTMLQCEVNVNVCLTIYKLCIRCFIKDHYKCGGLDVVRYQWSWWGTWLYESCVFTFSINSLQKTPYEYNVLSSTKRLCSDELIMPGYIYVNCTSLYSKWTKGVFWTFNGATKPREILNFFLTQLWPHLNSLEHHSNNPFNPQTYHHRG